MTGGASRSDSEVTENTADVRAQVAGRWGGRAARWARARGERGLDRGVVEAAERASGPSAGREGGRAGLGLRGKKGWARKLRTGPVRDFGLGFQGMLGWVWVEFGLGFLGFFSILFPLSFLFLNQTKFEFKYKFEFKPHSNN